MWTHSGGGWEVVLAITGGRWGEKVLKASTELRPRKRNYRTDNGMCIGASGREYYAEHRSICWVPM